VIKDQDFLQQVFEDGKDKDVNVGTWSDSKTSDGLAYTSRHLDYKHPVKVLLAHCKLYIFCQCKHSSSFM
jgi:hypothetical protein